MSFNHCVHRYDVKLSMLAASNEALPIIGVLLTQLSYAMLDRSAGCTLVNRSNMDVAQCIYLLGHCNTQ